MLRFSTIMLTEKDSINRLKAIISSPLLGSFIEPLQTLPFLLT